MCFQVRKSLLDTRGYAVDTRGSTTPLVGLLVGPLDKGQAQGNAKHKIFNLGRHFSWVEIQ